MRLGCYAVTKFRKDHIGQGELEMETGEKILVVDDNNFLRSVVAKMLSMLGYEVLSADSGENGLSLFLKNKFDIVLSDYEMPGMDGVAFACSVKKSSPRTPVVIMTGAGRETVFSRKSTAVDEVISKPFTLAEIDETIQSLSGKALFA
jgi:CheY-like chemotaxis protein